MIEIQLSRIQVPSPNSKTGQAVAVLFLIPFLNSGCHTMAESYSPTYSSGTATYQTKNSEGETVTRTISRPSSSSGYDTGPGSGSGAGPIYIAPTPPSHAVQPKPLASQATSSTNDSQKGFNGSLDMAWTSGHLHLGGHAGLNFTDWFMIRLGLSAFASKDLYLGGDLSTRLHAPLGFMRPFVGAGVYFGDSKKCTTEYNTTFGSSLEVCDKKFLTAGYGEAGVEFGHVSIFVRDYRLSRAGLSVPTEMFWGVGLRF